MVKDMLPHTIPPGSWMIFSIFSSVGSRPSAAIRLILSQQALMPAHTRPRQCPPLHANKTILSYLHAGFGLELNLKKIGTRLIDLRSYALDQERKPVPGSFSSIIDIIAESVSFILQARATC